MDWFMKKPTVVCLSLSTLLLKALTVDTRCMPIHNFLIQTIPAFYHPVMAGGDLFETL